MKIGGQASDFSNPGARDARGSVRLQRSHDDSEALKYTLPFCNGSDRVGDSNAAKLRFIIDCAKLTLGSLVSVDFTDTERLERYSVNDASGG